MILILIGTSLGFDLRLEENLKAKYLKTQSAFKHLAGNQNHNGQMFPLPEPLKLLKYLMRIEVLLFAFHTATTGEAIVHWRYL